MAAAVQAAVDTFGRLDVMYCNAGIPEIGFGQIPFEDTSLENFNKVLAVNLGGVFLGAREATRQFIKQGGGGTIVVTSSTSGLVAYPGFRSYVAAKSGVNGLVRALAVDLGQHGIRINALCPFHGMSANFMGNLEDAPLEKSYEQMAGDWDQVAYAIMPLKLDRPPTSVTTRTSRCSSRPTSRPTCRACAFPRPTAAPTPRSRSTSRSERADRSTRSFRVRADRSRGGTAP